MSRGKGRLDFKLGLKREYEWSFGPVHIDTGGGAYTTVYELIVWGGEPVLYGLKRWPERLSDEDAEHLAWMIAGSLDREHDGIPDPGSRVYLKSRDEHLHTVMCVDMAKRTITIEDRSVWPWSEMEFQAARDRRLKASRAEGA